MTIVTVSKNKIKLEGHSGDKLVCSFISGLMRLVVALGESYGSNCKVDPSGAAIEVIYEGEAMERVILEAVEVLMEMEVEYSEKVKVIR